MTAKDKLMIYGYAAIWKALSDLTAKKLKQVTPSYYYEKGVGKFNELKNNPDNLQLHLDDYEYKGDPLGGKLNIVFPPWYICLQMKGDCDDSAFLISKILDGQVWAIIKDISNTDAAGHCIFWETSSSKEVWSNFRFDGEFDSIKDIADNYVRKWKYAIQLSSDIKIVKIIER
jgi:hypothetical protein